MRDLRGESGPLDVAQVPLLDLRHRRTAGFGALAAIPVQIALQACRLTEPKLRYPVLRYENRVSRVRQQLAVAVLDEARHLEQLLEGKLRCVELFDAPGRLALVDERCNGRQDGIRADQCRLDVTVEPLVRKDVVAAFVDE